MSWDYIGDRYRRIKITEEVLRAIDGHLGTAILHGSDVGGEIIADLETGALIIVRDEYRKGDDFPVARYERVLHANGQNSTNFDCYRKTSAGGHQRAPTGMPPIRSKQRDPDCNWFYRPDLIPPWMLDRVREDSLRGQLLGPVAPAYKVQEIFLALAGREALEIPGVGSTRLEFFREKEAVIKGLRRKMGLLD